MVLSEEGVLAKQRTEPRISINKLAQYVTSRAARQNQILRNAKFPPDYITTYYREAGEAIARFLSSNMIEAGILERAIKSLSQAPSTNVYETRRLAGNIDALETFAAMLDDVELGGPNPA